MLLAPAGTDAKDVIALLAQDSVPIVGPAYGWAAYLDSAQDSAPCAPGGVAKKCPRCRGGPAGLGRP